MGQGHSTLSSKSLRSQASLNTSLYPLQRLPYELNILIAREIDLRDFLSLVQTCDSFKVFLRAEGASLCNTIVVTRFGPEAKLFEARIVDGWLTPTHKRFMQHTYYLNTRSTEIFSMSSVPFYLRRHLDRPRILLEPGPQFLYFLIKLCPKIFPPGDPRKISSYAFEQSFPTFDHGKPVSVWTWCNSEQWDIYDNFLDQLAIDTNYNLQHRICGPIGDTLTRKDLPIFVKAALRRNSWGEKVATTWSKIEVSWWEAERQMDKQGRSFFQFSPIPKRDKFMEYRSLVEIDDSSWQVWGEQEPDGLVGHMADRIDIAACEFDTYQQYTIAAAEWGSGVLKRPRELMWYWGISGAARRLDEEGREKGRQLEELVEEVRLELERFTL